MARSAAGPQRTCVVCRRVGPADSMLRTSRVGDRLDLCTRGGRGAWVCARTACVRGLERAPALAGRSLKAQVSRAGPLWDAARAALQVRVTRALGDCVRAGLVRRPAIDDSARPPASVVLCFADGTRADLPAAWWPWASAGAWPAEAPVGAGQPARRLADGLRQLADMG